MILPDSSSAPFFIVGCPRSGTTLLQTLLDAHPRLAIPPESHIFEHFSDMFNAPALPKSDEALQILAGQLLRDRRIVRWDLQILPQDLISAMQTRSKRSILNALFGLYCKKTGKSRWGEKTPQHSFYLETIRQIFPGAKIIHLVRDGRDVAESLQRVFFGPKTIDKIARYWKKYILAFRNFSEKVSGRDCLEVHYENLVRNPQEQAGIIFEFLGEDPHATGASTSREHYLAYDEIHDSLNQTVSMNKIGRYKKVLSARECEIFEAIAGHELMLYGYERLYPQARGMNFQETLLNGVMDPAMRIASKWGHWDYLRGEWQYRLRSLGRK